MKEIKAVASTAQDWIKLVRENERLRDKCKQISLGVDSALADLNALYDLINEAENKTNGTY